MNQDELAKKLDMHGAVIGRYERDAVKPSIEMAAANAEALEVALDYLVGNSDLLLEKNVLNKIMDIQKLGSEDKAHVFAMLDAFLQSHKAKKVFAT
jgi:transcriptional regulator with XRE-family HTH domain